MDKLVYTPKETAEVLCIGLNRTYELIQMKHIPSVRVGRKLLIPKQALENWLVKAAGESVCVEV